MNTLDKNFAIELKEIEKIKDLQFEYKGVNFTIPIYQLNVDEFVNSIITKVAEVTSVAQKFNYNPTLIVILVKLFQKHTSYSVNSLNSICNNLLKYKELGYVPIIYPYEVEIQYEYTEGNELKTKLHFIYPLKQIKNVILNYNFVAKIISLIMKNDYIIDYFMYTDNELIYVQNDFIDGYQVIQVNTDKFKKFSVKALYTTYYAFPIDYIDFLIQQNMKKPKQINISKDSDKGKYLISWEY